MQFLRQLYEQLRVIYQGMSRPRRIGLLVLAGVCLAAIVLVGLLAFQTDYQVLYSGLERRGRRRDHGQTASAKCAVPSERQWHDHPRAGRARGATAAGSRRRGRAEQGQGLRDFRRDERGHDALFAARQSRSRPASGAGAAPSCRSSRSCRPAFIWCGRSRRRSCASRSRRRPAWYSSSDRVRCCRERRRRASWRWCCAASRDWRRST